MPSPGILWGALAVILLVLVALLAAVVAMAARGRKTVGGGGEPAGPIPADAPEGLRVFGIGLNKTGTSSLGRFLRAAGFRLFEDPSARRMREAAAGDPALFAAAASYGAFEDWPWPRAYRRVAELVPGARFVLTTRADAGEWYDSLARHALRTGPTDQRRMAYGHATPTPATRAEHVAVYEKHTRDVERFFADRPGRLLVLSTATPDAEKSARLAAFLGMPRLARLAYPVVNRGKAPKARATPAPPARWAADTAAALKAGRVRNLGKLARAFAKYGYLVPVTSKSFQKGKHTAAEMLRALADDTRAARMPRFVHVPKTGGTAVFHRYVVNNLGHVRGVAADLMVCRNPHDRLASAYKYLRMAKTFWHADAGRSLYGKHPLAEWCRAHSYTEFVEAVCVAGTLDDRHVWPQAEFSPNGVAHLARFESLDADLARLEEEGVLRRSQYAPPAGVRNASAPVDLGQFTLDRIEAVEAFYADDFARFGYDRDEGRKDSPVGRAIGAAREARALLAKHDDALAFLEDQDRRVLPGVALAAAKHCRPAALRRLLGLGVSPDTADARGTSLLHLVAYGGCAAGTSLLLERGGDRGTKNAWGETPGESAKKQGHSRVAALLA